MGVKVRWGEAEDRIEIFFKVTPSYAVKEKQHLNKGLLLGRCSVKIETVSKFRNENT